MLNRCAIADRIATIKSNVLKWERRGKQVAKWFAGVGPLYIQYFERALAAEPTGSPRRQELLMERAGLFSCRGRRNAKARLRKCEACQRPYLGPLKARHHSSRMTHFCPGCRTIARQTTRAKHEKAIYNAWRPWRKLQRIRQALGDPSLAKPRRCQHGQCPNERFLRQTWTRLDQPPKWLCFRHRWYAERETAKHPFKPRPVGRPRTKSAHRTDSE